MQYLNDVLSIKYIMQVDYFPMPYLSLLSKAIKPRKESKEIVFVITFIVPSSMPSTEVYSPLQFVRLVDADIFCTSILSP